MEKFEAWQRTHWLAPSQVLSSPDASPRAKLLPFWLFEAKVRVRYTGKTLRQHGAHDDDASSGGDGGAHGHHDSRRWEQQPWLEVPVRIYPWTRLAMQVYAGYDHRPALAQAAKFEGAVGRSRPLAAVSGAAGSAAGTFIAGLPRGWETVR